MAAFCSWFASVFVVSLVTHSPTYGSALFNPDQIEGGTQQQKTYHDTRNLENASPVRVQLMQKDLERVMDDVETLKHEVSRLTAENVNLRHEIVNLLSKNTNERTPIAFYAYYSNHFKSLPAGGTTGTDQITGSCGRTFIFDSVETNLGNGYDKTTGVFTAPTSGLYAFAWTLTAAGTHIAGSSGEYGEMGGALTQNGIKKGNVVADTEKRYDEEAATGFVVLNVKAGDEIKIVSPWNGQGSMYSDDHYGRTTFSGYRIN